MILLKSLTATPFPDFHLCISLLGDAPVRLATINDISEPSVGKITEPVIVHIGQLSSLLFSCKYVQFWNVFYSDELIDVRKYTANMRTFEDDIRRVVLETVKSTFRMIPLTRIERYLHLQGADLTRFVEQNDTGAWSIIDGQMHTPFNPDNGVKSAAMSESVSSKGMNT